MSHLLSQTRFVYVKTMIFLGAGLFVACGGTNLERPGGAKASTSNTPVPVERDKEDSLANRLSALYDAKDCRGFFDTFPSSFSEFVRLYGFNDATGESPLYSKYENHIQYFLSCPDITIRERLEKVIGVGVGGKWDADATAMIQEASYGLIKENSAESEEIFDRLPETQASSFWFFVLDGPHPRDKAALEKVNVLVSAFGKEATQSKLLTMQHQKLLRNPNSD